MTLQDMLLQIVGPISPLSTQVVVQGCGSGSVQLFSGATPVSAPTAGDGVVARVQPFPGSLVPGMQIVAREYVGGQAVGPTSPPQVVSPAPTADDMGLLTFLEVPTTCVDWVVVGGSYPGATVEVLHGGVPVGRETATGPTTSVRLTLAGRLTAGDTLEAVQYCEPAPGTVLRSPHAFSAPAEKAPPFGTISVDQPVECDLELHLTALPRGASLVVDHNGDVLAGYPYVGPSPRARLRDKARIGDRITVHAMTDYCERTEPTEVTVAPASPLQAYLTVPVCPSAPAVTVTNTKAGTSLTIRVEKRAPGTGELLGNETIGWCVAPGPVSENVPLTPGWGSLPVLGNQPGELFLFVHQQGCSWSAPETGIPVSALPASVAQPVIVDAYACTARVRVEGLTPGAFVEISTNRTDLLELASKQRVYTANQTLQLYRKLHPGEILRVRQTGCSADAMSAPYTVTQVGAPPVDIVEPVRKPHKAASFKNLTVGARLHIAINGLTVVSLDVTAPEMIVPLPMIDIRPEQWVTATQELCGKTSEPSNSVQVTRGRLVLVQDPRSVTRGNTETVTIGAADADTGTPVTGGVYLATTKVTTTGTPFTFAVPASGPLPRTIVNATDYELTEHLWDVRDKPPTPPPPLAAVHLSVASEVGDIKVAGVTWILFRRELDGSLTKLAELDGATQTWTPPGPGDYAVAGAVVVNTSLGTMIARFVGNSTAHPGHHLFAWPGTASLTLGWRLMWETSGAYPPISTPVAFLAIA